MIPFGEFLAYQNAYETSKRLLLYTDANIILSKVGNRYRRYRVPNKLFLHAYFYRFLGNNQLDLLSEDVFNGLEKLNVL